MPMPIEIPTLAGTMRELAGRGFTEHFIMVNETLRGVDSKTMFWADEVTVAEYHRFEGASDPDDMAILYAVQTRSGARGTLADAFGIYADPRVGDFMREVMAHPRG